MGPQVHAKHRPDFKLLFTLGKKQIWIHALKKKKIETNPKKNKKVDVVGTVT